MYVLIVGAGKVGWNLARELIDKGHELTLVESDRRRYEVVEEEMEHNIQYGDGTELWILDRAGIERADLVIAVTGDDEDNILICQMAREKYGVERVVARCNNPRNLQHFELLGVKPAVSATDLILRLIEHEVPKYGLVHLLDLKEERLEIIEMEVSEGSAADGVDGQGPRPARRLARDLRSCATAAGSCPPASPVIRAGDEVLLVLDIGLEDAGHRALHRAGHGLVRVAAREVDHLLVGGGLAAANCARWLREEGGRRDRSCWWAASRTRRTTARRSRRATCAARSRATTRCSARPSGGTSRTSSCSRARA